MEWFATLLLTPVSVQQTSQSDCGLACLAAVARILGRHTSLADVAALAPSAGQGMTLADVQEVAGRMRLCSRAVRADAHELKGLALPAILHWDKKHFVVLRRCSDRAAWIMDPAFGERRVLPAELSQRYSGAALELWPGDQFVRRRAPREHVRRIMRLLAVRARVIGWLVATAFCLQMLALAGPVASQLLIDEVLMAGQHRLLWPVLAFLGGAGLASALLGSCRNLISSRLKAELDLRTSRALLAHLLRLPIRFHLQQRLSATLVRMESLEALRRFVHGALADGLLAVASALLCAAALTWLSPWLALVAVVAWSLRAVIAWGFAPWFRSTLERQATLSARTSGSLLESLRNITTIRMLGIGQHRLQAWQDGYTLSQAEGLHQVKLAELQRLFAELTGLVETLVVLTVGAGSVLRGDLTVGTLLGALLIRQRLADSFAQIGGCWRQWQLLSVHTERLGELAGEATPPPLPVKISGEVSVNVHNVTAGYPGVPCAIDRLTANFCVGQLHVITGPSGTGKSLLLKLIAGLLQPEQGRVEVVGCPAHRLPREDRIVSGVLHGDSLVRGTLLDNLTSFEAQPDLARVTSVLAEVELEQRISRLPMGLSTLLADDGAGLSAGEAQRLMLARALYRRPRLLLLDEATSHIDEFMEQRIVGRLRALGITVIAVAHRSGFIQRAHTEIRLNSDGQCEFQTVASRP